MYVVSGFSMLNWKPWFKSFISSFVYLIPVNFFLIWGKTAVVDVLGFCEEFCCVVVVWVGDGPVFCWGYHIVFPSVVVVCRQ